MSVDNPRVQRALQALLRLNDGPDRTAAAFALGVFFSFSPFLGLQILLSMSLAFLLGLNRVAVFIGLNANLPWFMAPWYALTTAAAAAAFGVTGPSAFEQAIRAFFTSDWSIALRSSQPGSILRPLLLLFLIGPTVAAAAVAAVAFLVARGCLVRRASAQTAAHSP
jgi:uncharacterized protein (DUF2062 family)